MPREVPHPTPIYHITHVENLGGIVATGGIAAKNVLLQQQDAVRSIAYENIQDRRARKPVPCAAGGALHDYVPFYFGPRSPMLYAISRGNVPACPEGQTPILHLVSSVRTVQAAGLTYAFTDGHAAMAFTSFFTDPAELSRVDWPLMRQMMWNDTPEDPDRARRRQAEFLVHGFIPWPLVEEIGVCTATAQVQRAIAGSAHRPKVEVRRGWYY